MAGLLVPAVFVLGCLAVIVGRDRLGFGHCLREAILASGTFCGGFVWVTLELLGLADGVTKWPVRACWATATVVLAAYVWRNRAELTGRFPRIGWPGPASAVYATVCGLALAWTGLTAALVPTTNIDALVYHLPRQLQHVQNGNVAHFPAQDYRLTVNPPFAEFAGITAWTLTGGDCWANVPQWAALGLAMVAVSLTARELGAPASGQWLAAALAATLPIAFQQAASPKNDLMAGCWLTATGFWTVRAWTASEITVGQAILVGLSVGLLVLTKGTGVVFGAVVAGLGFAGLLTRRSRGWLLGTAIVAVIVPLVNLGHVKRNLVAYGSVTGQTFGLGNERFGVGQFASSLLRNVSPQLALPCDVWNATVADAVKHIHGQLGLPLNDPALTWQSHLGYAVAFAPYSWEQATAPVHTVLALLTLSLAPLAVRGPGGRVRAVALLAAVGAFAAFCLAFKWQPSNARLLLPAQMLFCAPIAWMLSLPVLRWLGPVFVTVAVAVLVPIISASALRMPGLGQPWSERWTPEARYGPFDDAAYLSRLTAGRVQNLKPASVAFVNNPICGWEYPLARTIQQWVKPTPRIGYFYPVPEVPDPSPASDVVIDFCGDAAPAVIRHPSTGRAYLLTDRVGTFSVYQPLPPGREAAGTGYRLTPDGHWEPVAEPTPAGPPTGAQSVARFGVRIEPPAAAAPARHPR